ncbi:hypothetical protein HBI68_199930 [Parastagonospora nodorum]|nr:hypothetical protein HBI09_112070 [Parastagonospora nodorum]KAH5006662.1 hypothetical protein HBI77_108500 [Parastagonospora nodorum]KAH6108867.1 hypothetical protein HBI69_164860 [Parastagonospora nodorum]KAH6146971.1 hypothetical protein HBI68_199930 [Parastagonospora nodorum]
MDMIHIAELNPELPFRDTKQFKAAVTLIWPYSSSQRQFALLLAESDFRLRRKKGQVRVRFSGSSAKALATTGVGIGDEVVLSLRGAQFVQDDTVSTPGRSIDWELEYKQTVAVQVFREGAEIANLELYDAAPTPARRSPVRQQTSSTPGSAQQWSSPAFLKRARLSDGPFFEAPYDPLTDENADGHDKKRRRKSYRDWKAWTYNARTPSPEKGDVGTEEELEEMDASPSRPSQLPRTPISPSKSQSVSLAAGTEVIDKDKLQAAPIADPSVQGVDTKAMQKPNPDDFVRDGEYYDLYAGPDEDRPIDSQYAFGGDTEANTEEETLEDTDAASISPTEAATEDMEQNSQEPDRVAGKSSQLISQGLSGVHAGDMVQDGGTLAESQTRDIVQVTIDDVDSVGAEKIEAVPRIAMPPPTLSPLNTSFNVPRSPGALTPIGNEPASPTLKPLDSALLPLPSPFPGERESNVESYFDEASTSEPAVELETAEEERPPSEASYIMENSFFSSIGSSKANPFHPDHESAFTPVRFTFGMDGAGYSRPLDLSSPAPEAAKTSSIELDQDDAESVASGGSDEVPETIPDNATFKTETTNNASGPATASKMVDELPVAGQALEAESPKAKQAVPEVIELSSDPDLEDSDKDEIEEQAQPDEAPIADEIEREDGMPKGPSQSAPVSTIVDLGSPPASREVDDMIPETLNYNNAGQADQEGFQNTLDASLQHQDVGPSHTQPVNPESDERHSELIAMDYAPVFPDFTTNTHGTATAHTTTQEGSRAMMEANVHDQPFMVDLSGPYPGMEIPDTFMEGTLLEADSFYSGQWETEDVEGFHPDVKLESVEEGSVFRMGELDTQGQETTEPSGEMLIEVSEEGHKVGELHTIAVPASGPARNTRSKAKTSASPAKDDISPPKRTTRSTKSKASVTPLARTTMSPPMTQDRSTISPSVDGSHASPYSLRSRSKLLSPIKSTSAITPVAAHRSPRKHASQPSVESIPDVSSPQPHDMDNFLKDFQPSQALDASQGRYSNASFVKDSEEESLHSERSLSTVKYSDEWNTFTNFSDPLGDHEQNKFSNLKPPPASAPQAETRAVVRTEWKRSGTQVAPSKSSPARSDFSMVDPTSQGSPGRKLRSRGSTEAVSSPRVTRVTRQHSRNVSLASQQADNLSESATPKAKRLAYPAGEGEVIELPSSPPASADIDETMRSSTPAPAPLQSLNRQSIMDSNRPITPDATQQTNKDSQNSTLAVQQQQTLPITPQLTQATSAGLRSIKKSMMTESMAVETPVKSSPTRVTRSTPRRNAVQTDAASPSAKPRAHSPDVSSEHSITAVEEPDEPSIGLSTPLAYYTPLNALTYFLNRSSQFHTSSNPDVLALVTAGTTPPQRSTRGRKDWTTTLHITDISTYPATTTVNIFRPYQNALPAADTGDVVLLRAFAVKSLNRHPTLTSADESSWCVWRYAKPVWGAKRSAYGELRAREEVKGPVVERGEGEWREVEKIRGWFLGRVKGELEGKVHTRSQDRKEEEEGSQRVTRSQDKKEGMEEGEEGSQRVTRSRDKHLEG